MTTSVKARALGRVTGRLLRGHRVVKAGIEAGAATVKAGRKAARVLWLEVMGTVFVVVAISGAVAAWREYDRYARGQSSTSSWRVMLAAGIALMFAYFAATSFHRASRKHEDGR